MKYVASSSEFVPDTSLSVHNSRKNKADIVPYVNSILPFLRQNVADFGTKKHCIEIINLAATLLNPVQTILDTSDQPVYALSKRLQQMHPHKFGQRKYCEIHDQLIADCRLPRFLNYSKILITGAGNIALNVPNITSARYLIQVYLCEEFKAMMFLSLMKKQFLTLKNG